MKTYMAKPQTVEAKWYLVDATNMPLGRLASQVASILRGKNKPEYTPHVDMGDYVIVINTDKVVLTGNKLKDKKYFHHTGFVGGMKEVGYDELMRTKSDFVVQKAVKGMLPKKFTWRSHD
jgi:large subunit ribosomal protein L13